MKKKRALTSDDAAIRLAQEVKGLTLAHAYVVLKSAGFYTHINKFDGVPYEPVIDIARRRVNVDVVNGIVVKSWS